MCKPTNLLLKMNETDARETFPSSLHRMLTEIDQLASSDPSMAHLKSAISWQDHGMAFKIHDRKKFIELIMPQWFCRLKYTSFIRQLNLFGFKRIHKDGPDKGAMYHEDFLRDMPELAVNIPKVQRNKNRRPEFDREPNFQLRMPQQARMPMQVTLPRAMSVPVTAVEYQQASPRPVFLPSDRFDQHAEESKSLDRQSPNSLRDMLMPVLPPGGGVGPASMAVARFPTGTMPLGAGSIEQTTDSNFNPFSSIWQTLDATTTRHSEERLQQGTNFQGNAGLNNPLDIEPLRVFGPGDDFSESSVGSDNKTKSH